MTIEKTIEQIKKMHGDEREQLRRHAQFQSFIKRQHDAAAKEKSDAAA